MYLLKVSKVLFGEMRLRIEFELKSYCADEKKKFNVVQGAAAPLNFEK
jgi:hypothetical protein